MKKYFAIPYTHFAIPAKAGIYTLLLSFYFISPSFTVMQGQELRQSFTEANKAFEGQQYDQAISLYEKIISDSRLNSPEIYYNLGNAYYKTNKIGEALLNFERAYKLDPRDEDIRYNLNFLKNQVNDNTESDFISAMVNVLTAREVTLINTIVLILLLGVLITKMLLKNMEIPQVQPATYALLGLLVFFSVWSVFKIRNEKKEFGIVVTSACNVYNGPGEEFSVGFTPVEGKKVIILGENNGWYAIGLPNEKLKGWLKKDFVKKI